MKTIRFLITLCGALLPSFAAEAQSFTYIVENSRTTITGFSAEPSGAVVVPATLGGYAVCEIGRAAFKDRTAITNISFASSASVTKLGVMAFEGCTGLQTLSLPLGITSVPSGLARGCSNLTFVEIPSTVTSIGAMAFADCEKLTSITLPSSLTSIGDSALSNCGIQTPLTIPGGVNTIPPQLCNDCRALSSVSFSGNITIIGNNAFHNCASLTSLSLPNSVTSVGDMAFSGCAGLMSFEIGTGLANIGSLVFQGCDSLANFSVATGNTTLSSTDGVLFDAAKTQLILCPPARTGTYTIPSGITSLADGAFAHCVGLTSITLPVGLTAISNDAFYYATALTAPPLSSSITTIGNWAYAGLKKLTNLTIPTSVNDIGTDAFHAASSLAWVIYAGNAPASMGSEAFDAASDGFTVYFYPSSTGFTAPEWMGYTSVEIANHPAIVLWLKEHGFTPETNLLEDANNDGVNLLMTYAFGLDPALNLSRNLPAPVIENGTVSLTFQGNLDGIIYGAETSSDLQTWTTTGVTLSAPDANGQRRASVAVNPNDSRFLRLVVKTAE